MVDNWHPGKCICWTSIWFSSTHNGYIWCSWRRQRKAICSLLCGKFSFVWVVYALSLWSFVSISFTLCLACYSELQDGTWSTITGSCTVVRDVKDLLFHSYFSIMDDLHLQKPPDGEPYEIRSASCSLFAVYISFTFTPQDHRLLLLHFLFSPFSIRPLALMWKNHSLCLTWDNICKKTCIQTFILNNIVHRSSALHWDGTFLINFHLKNNVQLTDIHDFLFPRLLDIPRALIAAAFGLLLDGIMFTLIAFYKCPVMLFKGWKRLIQDMIGREGPFLETACVPFAGLAILLWPFAVVGAVLASILSSVPLGAYGAVVAYQVW